MKKAQRVFWATASFWVFILIQVQGADTIGTNSSANELFQTISNNDVAPVASILKANPALANAADKTQDPPLVIAAGHTNLAITRALLDAGAEVDKTGPSQDTALQKVLDPLLADRRYLARRLGPWGYRDSKEFTQEYTNDRNARLLIAKVLLDYGASIFADNGSQGSLMSALNQTGDGDLADFLLENQRAKNSRDANGNSTIHIAALWGRTNALVQLAKDGADLNATNFAGETALQAVALLPEYHEYLSPGNTGSPKWPCLDDDGPKLRELTASLLVSLGAKCDIFTAIIFNWTNVAANILSQKPALGRSKLFYDETPLNLAAEQGETNIAPLLLQAGEPIESTNGLGLRPLDVAAEQAQNGMVELLVNHGASVNRDHGVKTPLHWAAEQGNTPMLEFLVNAGAQLNAQDDQKQTPLVLAAKNDHQCGVRLLLAAHTRLFSGTNEATTPLHWAVANSDTNLIVLLLRHGADIEARDQDGRTPIFLAHERANFDVMELLLADGANINARDNAGNTMLHWRTISATDLIEPPFNPYGPKPANLPPARSMMEFLLEHGANANATNYAGQTPLHLLYQKSFPTNNSNQEVAAWVHHLLKYHANIEARDTNGCTPLELAVQNANYPLTAGLLELGANVNTRNHSGATALLLNLKRYYQEFEGGQQLEIIELLLQCGADVNIPDKSGTTPLHFIAGASYQQMDFNQKKPILDLLLKHGANVNAVDSDGCTPLHLACNKHGEPVDHIGLWGIQNEILPGEWSASMMFWNTWGKDVDQLLPDMLLTHGAFVNIQDHKGNTPLHYAAAAVRSNTIVLLLQNGAARTIRNSEGKTPLELLYEQWGGFNVIPQLQPHGVSGEIGDAARRNDIKMVKAFLKDDPKNANDSWLWGSTPLHWACNEGNLEMVKLLLAHGSEINPKFHQPLARLDHIIEFNRVLNFCQTVSIFYQPLTGEPTAKSISSIIRDGEPTPPGLSVFLAESPLQLAMANNHYEIARLLIKHGAKVDLASAASLGMINNLRNTIHTKPGIINEYSTRASWFFQPGTNDFSFSPDYKIQSGTLLHFAVLGNQPEIVRYLLKTGANASMLDDEGRTPFKLATEMKLPEIAAILKPDPMVPEPTSPVDERNGSPPPPASHLAKPAAIVIP